MEMAPEEALSNWLYSFLLNREAVAAEMAEG